MDKGTRGFLEKALDKAIKECDITEVNWFLDEHLFEASDEFGLGYMLGYLYRWMEIAVVTWRIKMGRKSTSVTNIDEKEIRDILLRRVTEIEDLVQRELNR